MRPAKALKGDVMTRVASRPISVFTGALFLSACATTPGTDRLAEKDPLHGFNRAMWSVNQGLDKAIARPVTKVYRAVTPSPFRSGIANFFSNLTEPWSFINALLQGKPKRAGRALERFAVNSTVGIGGLMDVASKHGKKQEPEDLGQTFAVWGMNGGPYLMLPLLGPTTMRDGVGSAIGQVADPYNACMNWCGVPSGAKWGLRISSLISARAQLMDSGADKLLDNSADSYATAHSAYLQRRRALILDQDEGTDAGTVDLEDFETTGDTAPATTTGETPNPSGETPPTPNAPSPGGGAVPTTAAPPAAAAPPASGSDAPPPAQPAEPSPAQPAATPPGQ
jgi:phospholipid-binding lipoprotein MlaA